MTAGVVFSYAPMLKWGGGTPKKTALPSKITVESFLNLKFQNSLDIQSF